MLVVSLTLNVLVLVPVTTGLLRQSDWAREVFGPRSPARGILTAVYLAILTASGLLLVAVLAGVTAAVTPVATLLTLQVIYKVLTPWTVGQWRHPVVLSNLAIASVHVLTLALIAPTLISP